MIGNTALASDFTYLLGVATLVVACTVNILYIDMILYSEASRDQMTYSEHPGVFQDG
jgi:hypothetical protein